MKNPLHALKEIISDLEQAAGDIAQKHDIEHLKGPQGRALYYLFKHQERDVFVKDIEQCLHISKSVASNLVKRMEKNGYLHLETSTEDKRYKRLVLTQEGVSKIEPLEHFHRELMSELFIDIEPDDWKVVEKVLGQLTQNLKQFKEKD
ncbi:MarR family winged helix-turn-helix transcriptional regulator [Streptococcus halotolerans]|uniref:MarR family winged helix-turn-helix transcriptional regulator n=1 Tax=Streptococcus halotolerans TaxID=1814128 RepID=UPI0007896D1A|nr:MarR family transcriptional regulator [Streptococcus halotolerans]